MEYLKVKDLDLIRTKLKEIQNNYKKVERLGRTVENMFDCVPHYKFSNTITDGDYLNIDSTWDNNYWYENSLTQLRNRPRALGDIMCEFVGTDFSILMYDSTCKIIKNERLIRFGGNHVMEAFFHYVLGFHMEVCSFYGGSPFYHDSGNFEFETAIYHEWGQRALYTCIIENGNESIRSIIPYRLYYKVFGGKLVKICMIVSVSSDVSYMRDKGPGELVDAFDGDKDSCMCSKIHYEWDFKNEKLRWYFKNRVEDNIDAKVKFFASDRHFFNVYQMSRVITPLYRRLHGFGDKILDQIETYYEKEDYFNVFEVFGSMGNTSPPRIQKMWRKWVCKAPSTTMFYICARLGPVVLPLEIIEKIVFYLL